MKRLDLPPWATPGTVDISEIGVDRSALKAGTVLAQDDRGRWYVPSPEEVPDHIAELSAHIKETT